MYGTNGSVGFEIDGLRRDSELIRFIHADGQGLCIARLDAHGAA